MEKRLLFLSLFLVNIACLEAQLIKTKNGILLKNLASSTHTLELEVISSNIIHLIASPTGNFTNKDSLSTHFSEKHKFYIRIESENILIRTDSLFVFIDSNNGKVTFKDNVNNLLLQEKNRLYKPSKDVSGSWSIKQEFNWAPDELLYSFLKVNGSNSNIRGKQIDLLQQDMDNDYPLISSSKGYAILWYNNSLNRFCDINDNNFLWSEKANFVDYYFLYATSAHQLITNYKTLISKFTKITNTTMGYMQPKDGNRVHENVH